jgi:tetratricopeptide (TPR) repeat protein
MAQRNRIQLLISMAVVLCTLICFAGEDTWIEVKSPNFVVISNANPKQAKRMARSFEQFRGLLQTVLPKLKVDPGSPLDVFATKDSASLKALLPLRQEKGAMQPAGIFMAGPESNTVVLRTDTTGDQGYHVIYHEYVHMVMRLNYQRLPLWLSEGLAEFFGYAVISDGTSSLGDPSPEQLQYLQTASMISLTTLMSVNYDSPYYRLQEKAQTFYAQSWALTHYLMVGDKQAHSKQLLEFIRLLQTTNISEDEAATRAFGDLKILERNLRNYVNLHAYYHYQIPAKLSMKEDQYAVRTLSLAESLALRGEVLVHSDRLDEAKTMLEQALQLDSRSAQANEGMGLLFMRRKDQAQAMKYFAAAAELDSKSLLSHLYASQLAWERDDLTTAENHLRKALAISPNYLPACKNLSRLLLRQEKMQEALELAQKVAELEPAEMFNRIHVGRILISMEKYDEAEQLARNLLAIARNDVDRKEIEGLLDSIKTHQEMIFREQKRAEAVKEQLRQIEEQRQKDTELAKQRQEEIETRRPQAKAEPIKTGPAGKVKGTIRSVKCSYPSIMDIVIDAGGKQQKLRAQNYYQVDYWAVDASGKEGFEPCEELEGKRVQIEFLSVTGQEFSGLIKTVAIEK